MGEATAFASFYTRKCRTHARSTSSMNLANHDHGVCSAMYLMYKLLHYKIVVILFDNYKLLIVIVVVVGVFLCIVYIKSTVTQTMCNKNTVTFVSHIIYFVS